jgi:citrate/tricarballylate utilization protein
MDRGLIALLFSTRLTGLALLAWRDTAAMALLKWAIEKRLPSHLKLGED